MKTRLRTTMKSYSKSAIKKDALLAGKKILAGTMSVLLLASGGTLAFSTVASAAPATTLFTSGFESGDFSDWDTPVSSNWEVNFGSITGFFGADAEGNTDGDDWLRKSISTAGFNTVALQYSFKAEGLDTEGHVDRIEVQYTTDGVTWNTVYVIADGEDDHIPDTDIGIYQKSHVFPEAASNNPDFAFQFNAYLVDGPDEVWIDDVSLTGEAIDAPEETTETATTTEPIAEESSYEHCNDGNDNDENGFTDLFDLGCLEFRQTVTITTQVSGGSATAADFLVSVLFGTTTLSANLPGSTTGIEVTSPHEGSWQILQATVANYSSIFSGDCDLNGFVDMAFNVNKNCTIANTFGTTPATTTATTTPPDVEEDGVSDTDESEPLPPQPASPENSVEVSGGPTGARPPACADGSDNDGDGFADFPKDPGCLDSLDDNESGAGLPGIPNTGVGEVLGIETTATSSNLNATSSAILGGETATTSCTAYLYEHLRPGMSSHVEEVLKLQMFLNEHMGAELPVTGHYGSLTTQWVKKFQLKHYREILEPWVNAGYNGIEVHEGSGAVYKTTKRHINMLKCPELNIPMPDLSKDL